MKVNAEALLVAMTCFAVLYYVFLKDSNGK